MSETDGNRPGDTNPLLALLAPLHAAALRLAGRGADASEIAADLGIPIESVAGVLDVAAAKLARLQRDGAER
jgi:hypothetical protein